MKKAKLNNGKIITYDLDSDDLTTDSQLGALGYDFLGVGVVWEIDGVRQNSQELRSFWRRA